MNDKLRQIRISKKLTQEDLAEKIDVSRQSIAKWENGESIPDILKCSELAKVFELSIEDIANIFLKKEDISPKGKYVFGLLKIDKDNKIIIPDKALKIFNLKIGDNLLLLGDVNQGMALLSIDDYNQFINQIITAPVFEDDEEKET